ncbi:uncharacterized protein DS421_3g80820 [Arachis hypogaea]|nr:uncharacterized protein DS421_3g80820 [Arachis hypogaea]
MSIRPSHCRKTLRDTPPGPPLPERLSMLHLEYPLRPPDRLTIGSDTTCWANRGELSTTGETSGGIKRENIR